MSLFTSHLDNQLLLQKNSQRYRQRKIVETAQDVVIKMNGKKYLNFCSNDYLGLANHPRLIKRQKQALDTYGCGSGASHLVCGHSSAHHALEEDLADFMGTESVLLFSSGYMANLGILNSILTRHDAVFEDRLNHASLIDAGLFTHAKMKRYAHVDMAVLEQQLQVSKSPNKLIISDAVFSMDGNIAPIADLIQLSEKNSAGLMLDDAHGFGVLGEQGRGSIEHFNLKTEQVDIYMATLGKAMGVSGAFVAGNKVLIETLIQFSRTYTYTTAMPAVLAETLRESLLLLQQESWRRDKLKQLIAYFKSSAAQLGICLSDSPTAIQPIMIGDNQTTINLAKDLMQQGIYVAAIRPPSVPEDTARLRITLSANHQQYDIDRLLSTLKKSMQEQNLCH
ncbi:MAG: 8-amino-7-oxononanoate synthase [Pseudomonadota bacterium]